MLILNNIKLQPIKFGGNGVESTNLDYVEKLPESFEVGTLPTPSILALNYGLNFVKKKQKIINKKIIFLSNYLIKKLKQNKNIIVYSVENNCYGGISFNIKNKYGKNAIVKGIKLQEAGTTIDRNKQIGGHKA